MQRLRVDCRTNRASAARRKLPWSAAATAYWRCCRLTIDARPRSDAPLSLESCSMVHHPLVNFRTGGGGHTPSPNGPMAPSRTVSNSTSVTATCGPWRVPAGVECAGLTAPTAGFTCARQHEQEYVSWVGGPGWSCLRQGARVGWTRQAPAGRAAPVRRRGYPLRLFQQHQPDRPADRRVPVQHPADADHPAGLFRFASSSRATSCSPLTVREARHDEAQLGPLC